MVSQAAVTTEWRDLKPPSSQTTAPVTLGWEPKNPKGFEPELHAVGPEDPYGPGRYQDARPGPPERTVARHSIGAGANTVLRRAKGLRQGKTPPAVTTWPRSATLMGKPSWS